MALIQHVVNDGSLALGPSPSLIATGNSFLSLLRFLPDALGLNSQGRPLKIPAHLQFQSSRDTDCSAWHSLHGVCLEREVSVSKWDDNATLKILPEKGLTLRSQRLFCSVSSAGSDDCLHFLKVCLNLGFSLNRLHLHSDCL